MQKIIKLALNVILVIIIGAFYLISSKPTMVLSIIYSLIGLTIILFHVLIIKNFNMQLDNYNCSKPKSNFFSILSKIFLLQSGIFLLTNWLFGNLLMQGESNSRFSGVSINLIPENSFMVLINGFFNWVIFISLLVAMGIYKYYFKSINLRLAKCLLPNSKSQPWIFFYDILLGIESYLRVIFFITLLTISLFAMFEIIANKFALFSFSKYPMITSSAIMILFVYGKKKLDQSIDFMCEKKSMNAVNIVIIFILAFSVTVFVGNQVLLQQIEFLNIIPENLTTSQDLIINKMINQYSIKILLIAVNFLVTFIMITDAFLKQIKKVEIWKIYFSSMVFPVMYSAFFYKFNLGIVMNNFLTSNIANICMLIFMLTIFRLNYKNIYLLFCFAGLRDNMDNGMPQSIKTSFSMVIKKVLAIYIVYFSAYYVFGWILTEHVMALGILFLLQIICMLIIKFNYLQLKTENQCLEIQ